MTTTITALLLATHAGHEADGPWFPFFPLVPLLVVGVALLTVGRRRARGARIGAEAVLAERYARGEIDATEYRERRAVLRAKGGERSGRARR